MVGDDVDCLDEVRDEEARRRNMVSYTAQGRVQEMLTKTPVRLRPRAAADQKATARARTGSAPLLNLNGENSNACVLSSWVAAVAPQPLGDALDVEFGMGGLETTGARSDAVRASSVRFGCCRTPPPLRKAQYGLCLLSKPRPASNHLWFFRTRVVASQPTRIYTIYTALSSTKTRT